MVTQSKFDYHKHLVWIARRCNIGPRWRVNLHVWPLQSYRELLLTASPWLLDDCTGSGRPIDIGVPLSNRPRRLGPYHMVGCQGRVAHTYWALMTNITACQPLIQHPLNAHATPQMHPTPPKRNSTILCTNFISWAVAGTKAEWGENDWFT